MIPRSKYDHSWVTVYDVEKGVNPLLRAFSFGVACRRESGRINVVAEKDDGTSVAMVCKQGVKHGTYRVGIFIVRCSGVANEEYRIGKRGICRLPAVFSTLVGCYEAFRTSAGRQRRKKKSDEYEPDKMGTPR